MERNAATTSNAPEEGRAEGTRSRWAWGSALSRARTTISKAVSPSAGSSVQGEREDGPGGWLESSWDLAKGLDVIEADGWPPGAPLPAHRPGSA